jgi:DNA-binding XRE family transcriptional regulator
VFAAINGAEAFGLDAAVPAGAEVHILPAIAGGSGVVVPVLGRELRKCRRQVKLTQIQLAELAGITQSRLSRIETGQVIPRLEQLASLCEALGAELDIRVRLP